MCNHAKLALNYATFSKLNHWDRTLGYIIITTGRTTDPAIAFIHSLVPNWFYLYKIADLFFSIFQ